MIGSARNVSACTAHYPDNYETLPHLLEQVGAIMRVPSQRDWCQDCFVVEQRQHRERSALQCVSWIEKVLAIYDDSRL